MFLDCDNAGIWNPDFEIASIYIDQKVERHVAEKVFEGKFIRLENGKWFLPDFIQHQYPSNLQPNNPAHKKVVETLTKLGFLDENKHLKDPLKGLARGFQATKDKGMGKEEGKDMEKGMGKEKESQPKKPKILIHPFGSEQWHKTWQTWIDFRAEIKKPYKTIAGEQSQLKWFSDKNYSEQVAIDIIYYSIRNQYQGLFEPKQNGNGKSTTTEERGREQDAIIGYVSEKFGYNPAKGNQ